MNYYVHGPDEELFGPYPNKDDAIADAERHQQDTGEPTAVVARDES